MTLFSNLALTHAIKNPLPCRQPGEVTRTLVDAALFTGDILVGRDAGCRDGSFTGDLRQTGLLTYGAMALTTAANVAASSVPATLRLLNPCRLLSHFVNDKWPLTDPAYWLEAALYGEQTWGVPVSNKLTCLLGAALGAARGPLAAWHKARDSYFGTDSDSGSISDTAESVEIADIEPAPVETAQVSSSEDRILTPIDPELLKPTRQIG